MYRKQYIFNLISLLFMLLLLLFFWLFCLLVFCWFVFVCFFYLFLVCLFVVFLFVCLVVCLFVFVLFLFALFVRFGLLLILLLLLLLLCLFFLQSGNIWTSKPTVLKSGRISSFQNLKASNFSFRKVINCTISSKYFSFYGLVLLGFVGGFCAASGSLRIC